MNVDDALLRCLLAQHKVRNTHIVDYHDVNKSRSVWCLSDAISRFIELPPSPNDRPSKVASLLHHYHPRWQKKRRTLASFHFPTDLHTRTGRYGNKDTKMLRKHSTSLQTNQIQYSNNLFSTRGCGRGRSSTPTSRRNKKG